MIALRQESQTQPSARSTAAKRKSLVPSSSATPAPGTTDAQENTHDAADPLLATKTLQAPSETEIEALLSAPPLSYAAARAAPPDSHGPPQRYFSEQCGHWGQIKCLQCGARTCGLACKQEHDVNCLRYA